MIHGQEHWAGHRPPLESAAVQSAMEMKQATDGEGRKAIQRGPSVLSRQVESLPPRLLTECALTPKPLTPKPTPESPLNPTQSADIGSCPRNPLVEEGFDAALDPKPRPRVLRKLNGQIKADIVALAKSDPPKGRKRWTLRLLASQLVELKCPEKISHESVRQVLKKMV